MSETPPVTNVTVEKPSKVESKPIVQMISEFLSDSYEFRYNEILGKIEFRNKGDVSYRPLQDYHINSLNVELNRFGVKSSLTSLRTLLNSNFSPRYNPFHSYLNNLPAWEGTTDYIQQLANTVSTTNNELWSITLRKWLIAMAGSLLKEEIVNHTVIVFTGKQGIGKTTWLLALVPPSLRDYIYSGTINPSNKDTLIHLSECIMVNLDELENLNRSELGELKELITKSKIRIRRPYGYTAENLPRVASFVGSVNTKEFLNDTTGSRRFLCFEATSINYQHNVPLDGVYAQAKYLFETGEKFWFDKTEIDSINENNEQYRSMSVEEELLLTYFEPCNGDEADHYLSTTQLVTWLSDKANINVNDSTKNKLGKALRARNFERLKRNGLYVYALRMKDRRQRELQSVYLHDTDILQN